MRDVLCVIDMQNDFVTGCLGSKEAQAIVPTVVQAVKEALGKEQLVVFTKDTHDENYLNTQEGRHLPVPHCLKGSDGHRLIPELDIFSNDACVIEKPTFGSQQLVELLKKESLQSITLMGVCTDICVISNALLLKQAFPEVPIRMIEAGLAGVTPEKHQAALETARSCQIEVI